jgi:hypothetical protein
MLSRLKTTETTLQAARKAVEAEIRKAEARRRDRRSNPHQQKLRLEFLRLKHAHLLEREAVGQAIKEAFFEGFALAQCGDEAFLATNGAWKAAAEENWPHTQAKADTEELEIIRPKKDVAK